MEDFDINKAMAIAATEYADDIFNNAARFVRKVHQKSTIQKRLMSYVDKMCHKHSKSRSFFSGDNEVPLGDFYIASAVEGDNFPRMNAEYAKIFDGSNFVVVTGTGGAGKSVLMKHLFLESLKLYSRIAVLIELRDVADGQMIVDALFESFNLYSTGIDRDVFEWMLKEKGIDVFLDGFDEVPVAQQAKQVAEVNAMQALYSNSRFLISSRPDEVIAGFKGCRVLRIAPLTLSRAIDLVNKTPVSEGLKVRFVRELEMKLFAAKSELLSNPLLLSIMLVTYRDTASVPGKSSLFYKQALEALYQTHDAWKGYRRPRKCSIDIEEFARVFSAFSVYAYDKGKGSPAMTQSEAIEYIKMASSKTGVVVNAEDFLSDANRAVCMLVKDGVKYVYPHRSFQEYFVARYISSRDEADSIALLVRYAPRAFIDLTYRMTYEINPDLIERGLIKKGLAEFDKMMKSNPLPYSREHVFLLLRMRCDAIVVADDNLFDVCVNPGETKTFRAAFAMMRVNGMLPFDVSKRLKVSDAAKKELYESRPIGSYVDLKDLSADYVIFQEIFDSCVHYGTRGLLSISAKSKLIKGKYKGVKKVPLLFMK